MDQKVQGSIPVATSSSGSSNSLKDDIKSGQYEMPEKVFFYSYFFYFHTNIYQVLKINYLAFFLKVSNIYLLETKLAVFIRI